MTCNMNFLTNVVNDKYLIKYKNVKLCRLVVLFFIS